MSDHRVHNFIQIDDEREPVSTKKTPSKLIKAESVPTFRPKFNQSTFPKLASLLKKAPVISKNISAAPQSIPVLEIGESSPTRPSTIPAKVIEKIEPMKEDRVENAVSELTRFDPNAPVITVVEDLAGMKIPEWAISKAKSKYKKVDKVDKVAKQNLNNLQIVTENVETIKEIEVLKTEILAESAMTDNIIEANLELAQRTDLITAQKETTLIVKECSDNGDENNEQIIEQCETMENLERNVISQNIIKMEDTTQYNDELMQSELKNRESWLLNNLNGEETQPQPKTALNSFSEPQPSFCEIQQSIVEVPLQNANINSTTLIGEEILIEENNNNIILKSQQTPKFNGQSIELEIYAKQTEIKNGQSEIPEIVHQKQLHIPQCSQNLAYHNEQNTEKVKLQIVSDVQQINVHPTSIQQADVENRIHKQNEQAAIEVNNIPFVQEVLEKEITKQQPQKDEKALKQQLDEFRDFLLTSIPSLNRQVTSISDIDLKEIESFYAANILSNAKQGDQRLPKKNINDSLAQTEQLRIDIMKPNSKDEQIVGTKTTQKDRPLKRTYQEMTATNQRKNEETRTAQIQQKKDKFIPGEIRNILISNLPQLIPNIMMLDDSQLQQMFCQNILNEITEKNNQNSTSFHEQSKFNESSMPAAQVIENKGPFESPQIKNVNFVSPISNQVQIIEGNNKKEGKTMRAISFQHTETNCSDNELQVLSKMSKTEKEFVKKYNCKCWKQVDRLDQKK